MTGRKTTRFFSICGALTAAVWITAGASQGTAGNHPIDDLPPGHWYEVPNSTLEPHLPDPLPPNWSGPDSILSAWSGGAYDTLNDRLLIWGGGHNDYGGNEVYAFDMEALSWSRIWGPSENIPDAGGPCNETYPDGNPASRHTYDGLAYIPAHNQFWSNGGSLFCGSGSGTFATWVFDLDTSTWSRMDDVPVAGYSTGLNQSSAYDPTTGHVFHMGTRTFTDYDPDLGTWTIRGEADEGWWEAATAAIDPTRRLFIRVGGGSVRGWNLSTWARLDPTWTGGVPVVDHQAPGLVYDPAGERFIGWAGGADIYSLDVNTWTWTRIPPAPANTVIPTDPPGTGVYGKFQYSPARGALILVNSIYENVYIYKLPPGNGTSADIAVTKQGAPIPALVGETLTYTLKVANHGPLTATNVTLTDPLPASAAFGSYTITQGNCSEAGGTVTCDLGDISSGGEITITLAVTPTRVGLLTNTAAATMDTPDSDPGNNAAQLDVYIFAAPPLKVYLPFGIRNAP